VALAACGAFVGAPALAAADPARTKEVEEVLEAWRLAWELGEWRAYARFYDPHFHDGARSRKDWERQRRTRLARKDVSVKLENVRVDLESAYRADVRFVQHYTAKAHTDVGDKRLHLVRTEGAWRITQEEWKPRR
jgi:hypothetical protein